jgi:hypothetical protein
MDIGINRGMVAALALALASAFIVQQLTASDADAADGPIATKSAKLKLISHSSLTLSQPNESPRAVALCPGSLEPYGGAQSADPDPLASSGEGVYPHSYERLGAQSGFHSTPVLFEPTRSDGTRNYQVTLQVLCGKKPGKIADPHEIALDVPSGTTKTLVAKCPKKTVLIGGGFQRAAWEAAGGVVAYESHAISKTMWQATGTAFGTIRNDFASIGYCMASPKRKQLLKEVSNSIAIAPRQVGFVTTPSCSSGRRLVWTGFDTNPKTGDFQGLLFADGIINEDDSFTASAYNNSSGPGTLTAYGYCLKERVIGGSLKKFTKKAGRISTPIPEHQRVGN